MAVPREAGGSLLGGLQKTQVTQALLSPGSCPGDTFTCCNTHCGKKTLNVMVKKTVPMPLMKGAVVSLLQQVSWTWGTGHIPLLQSTGLLGTEESQRHRPILDVCIRMRRIVP